MKNKNLFNGNLIRKFLAVVRNLFVVVVFLFSSQNNSHQLLTVSLLNRQILEIWPRQIGCRQQLLCFWLTEELAYSEAAVRTCLFDWVPAACGGRRRRRRPAAFLACTSEEAAV